MDLKLNCKLSPYSVVGGASDCGFVRRLRPPTALHFLRPDVQLEQRQPKFQLMRLTVERPANGSPYSIDFSIVHDSKRAAFDDECVPSESGLFAQKQACAHLLSTSNSVLGLLPKVSKLSWRLKKLPTNYFRDPPIDPLSSVTVPAIASLVPCSTIHCFSNSFFARIY